MRPMSLWIVAAVLAVLWAMALLFNFGGLWIHVLPVLALAVGIYNLYNIRQENRHHVDESIGSLNGGHMAK